MARPGSANSKQWPQTSERATCHRSKPARCTAYSFKPPMAVSTSTSPPLLSSEPSWRLVGTNSRAPCRRFPTPERAEYPPWNGP